MARKPAPSHSRVTARKTGGATPGTRFHRHRGDFSWTGVRTEQYKPRDGTWADIAKRVLAGTRGENTRFHLRYFEIAPGGYSSLERHRHEHVVIGIRGRGRCRVGRRTFEVGHLDTLYISPDAPHQLTNPFAEPFGFFCVVNARRDRPKILKK